MNIADTSSFFNKNNQTSSNITEVYYIMSKTKQQQEKC